jgi:nucleotide-binding universal stress UspA family protein
MFKNILFPTDFSEGSAAAAAYVKDLATKYGSKVHLVHVIYDVAKASGWYVPSIDTEKFYAELRDGAQVEMEKFAKDHLGGVGDVETEVITGVPADGILDFVDEKGIDLVVMGTHGRSGIDRVIFGSTATRVVRRAACPVLSVRMRSKK